MSNRGTIKNQTAAPEWGTLAGELPKEFTDQIGEDLKDALHVRECGPGPDIAAIRWAHTLLSISFDLFYDTAPTREIALQMLNRLGAMLPKDQNTKNDGACQ